MRTETSRLFDELNAQYWRGRLPHYRVICRAKLQDDCLGRCDDRTKTILLRKDLGGKKLRCTLLHEMCHIGGPGGGNQHGPLFIRKLHRLIRLGETKLLGDLEQYDGTADDRMIKKWKATGKLGPAEPWRAAVQSHLEAAASNSQIVRMRWTTIRRLLAQQSRMSEAQFQRSASWAEREWKRLSREAREMAATDLIARKRLAQAQAEAEAK